MNAERLAQHTVELLKEEKALVLLGAGASMGDDTEQGVPSSKDLMEAIATRFGLVPQEDSDLESIATLAADDVGEPAVKRFVADKIKSSCTSVLKAHEALASIKPPIVLTTNYDCLYEVALRRQGEDFIKVVRDEDMALLGRPATTVIKLHGDVDAVDRMILTAPDFVAGKAGQRSCSPVSCPTS